VATIARQQGGPRQASAGVAPEHIRMRGITKRYGETVANAQIDFDVFPGEIHALLGENGAGKTTLMSILFGLVLYDDGAVWIGDEQVRFSSPNDALARGIGMVHQHFMLVQNFTVAENVVLGSASALNVALRRSEIEREVGAAAQRFGMGIDPRPRVRHLPIDTQQRVEILKLLYRGANVLILDEPTSSLGPAQIDGLFATLKDLRDAGHAVVIVTHKLSEVMEIADRVTVLKAGRKTTTVSRGGFDERMLARAMTGREIEELPPRSKSEPADRPLLAVRDLVVHAGTRLHAVHGVSFAVRPGEILGVAGVEGNGQRELVDALAGVARIDSGSVTIDGRAVANASPKELREAGVSVIHEDRHGWGLVLDMTLADNLAIADVPAGKASRFGFLRRGAVKERARRLLEEYDVRPPDPDLLVLSLSGGNQQKVVLARELGREPKVLVAANPTHGLDVGAADYVHRRLLEVREQGRAILLVSNDLDELLKLADRIIVLYRGQALYEAAVTEVSMDDLALAMAGRVPGGGGPTGPADPGAGRS
jgi:simple sugar transport system ATP-binding protein